MQKENEKINASNIMEGMASVSAVIKAYENNISDRRIEKVFIDRERLKAKEREIRFLRRKSAEMGFEINVTDKEFIDQNSVGNSHGGIIAFCSERTLENLSADKIKPNGVYYMLEGIEDPYNFGYALRSIYAAGGDGIILSPRNWLGVAGVVARSSAGCSELIDMYVSDAEDAVDVFKQCGYTVVCAGIRNSESIFTTDLKKPLFVILGGEKRGISRAVLDKSDKTVRIDYGRDFNGSLSSAAACAVFAFEILRANTEAGMTLEKDGYI